MIEQTIVAALLASAEVTAIVVDRIECDPLRQDTAMPAVSYRKISGSRGRTLDGPDGTAFARMQFDCWAADKLTAINLHEAVIDVLEALDGDVSVSADLDSYEPEPGLQRVTVDVEILYLT